MAEVVMLWEGGTRADQWAPVSGDTINTKVSSKFATVEWPSNRDAMGLVAPYFIRTTFPSDNSGTTRDAIVALQFHNLPQTVGNDKFIQFNASLVVHENGKKVDDSYRVEISLNNSYINDAILMQSGDSITYSGNCDNMAVTLPVDIKYIKFTIRNLPSKYECFFCLNKILISDTDIDREYEQFNDTNWIKKYAYIVEDPNAVADDEYIKNYVNWPTEEVQTYDNGNHTLSPLGFPNENNSGVPNVPDCAESGSKPVFVSQMFGVKHTIPSDILEKIAFTSKVNIDNLRGCNIVIPVLSLGAYDDNTMYELVVNGDISNISYSKMGIEAIGADTLANTHLLRGNILPSEVTMEYDADSDSTYVTISASDECEITHLGANIIGLSFTYNIYPVYISLQGQTDTNQNGIYMLTDETSYWRKLGADLRDLTEITDLTDPDTYPYADRTSYDNVWVCCDGINKPHFRRNYSDKEVYDYTNAKTGVFTGFGVHSPEIGSNECNGAFVQWFVTSGQVDLASGNSVPVFVDAFGLGDAYANDTNTTPADALTVERGDTVETEPLHPLLQWGIGANADAKDAVSKISALPLDWPFSRASAYATTANNNNITLVREGAEIAGSSDTFGNLDYTDDDGNRVEINKHIITIYNDLRPTAKDTQVVDGVTVNGHGSGEDGATVIKPTFIHIPAPLSTKDGDTVEIEVALENINIDQAFPGATAKDLSGYYALMSQPRVYVVGGFQNIISSRYKISDPTTADITTDYFDIVTKDVVRKDNNEILPVGTDVRLQLSSTQMKPTHTYFTARVVAKTDTSTSFRCYGKFPYDLGGRGWKSNALSVCGIAYMAEVPDSDLYPSTTPMGLVTRTPEILGVDYGEGGEGDLDQYNKFFSLNRHVEGRYTFPGNDKRYLLATVYQSSTSTFPWALSGRKKLRHLGKLMTNEADLGPNSITAQAWELNKELLSFNDTTGRDFRDVTMDSDRTYYRFSTEDVPVSYNSTVSVGEGESAVASKLRVTLPASLSSDYVRTSDGNPVRQARRAYNELIKDFKLTRCGFGDKLTSSYSMNGCGIDIGLDGRDAMPAKNAFFTGRTQIAYNNDPEDNDTYDETDLNTNAFPLYNVGDDMWAIKLRHIPMYMRDAYYDTAYMSYNHYWEGFDGRFKDYLQVADYCSEMGIVTASTDSEAEVKCSLVGTPNMPRRYSEQRSVIKVINSKYASIHNMFLVRDMSKYADTQESWIDESLRDIEHRYKGTIAECTECGGEGTIMGVDEPEVCPTCHGHGYVDDAPADLPAAWEEIWSSCTKIFSLDYVPYPVAAASDADDLSDAQHAFISGDVVQKYVDAEITEDPIRIVTEIMPQSTTEEDLLKVNTFMANLTPEYASGLPKRFYASSRILLKNGACENDDMYFKCAKWVERLYEDCEDKTALLNRYVNDNFALLPDEAGTLSSIDRNMDWRNLISGSATERSLELNISAPPYTVDNTFVSQAGNAGGTGYTRMYMQFTFCAKAGRWLTTGYRQYPTSFLTPLYGAKALKAKLGSNIAIDSEHGDYVWADSMCDGFGQNYHVATSIPYVAYEPMDIRLSCVPYLYTTKPYDMYGNLLPEADNSIDAINTIKMSRLLKPYLPIADGGLDLYPPTNVNGDDNPLTRDGIHANIWSVRKYLRPAVTALYGTDIPSEEEYTGGSIANPTLNNMFDFPMKGVVKFHIPDVVDPTIDRTAMHIAYAEDGDLGDIVTDKGELLNIPEFNP